MVTSERTGNQTKSKAKILIVEDEQISAIDLQRMVEDCGYSVVDITDSAEACLESIKKHSVDLVLMDINLVGETDGIEAATTLQERYEVPIVYITANSHDENLQRAKTTQPEGFLIKPVTQADLQGALETALPESVN